MSVQTNFRAIDMLGGAKPEAAVEAPKVVAPKKAAKAAPKVEVASEPVVEAEAVVVEAEPEAVEE